MRAVVARVLSYVGVAVAVAVLAVVALVAIFAVVAVIAGCSGSAVSSDPGLSADLQVEGARFSAGAPASGGDGPAVRGLQLADAHIAAGAHDRPLLGQLDPSAAAVTLRLDGDRGYWIVPAGVPATEAPTLPTFDVRLAFARTLPTGARTLIAQAVDANGHVGAPSTLALDIAGAALPSGALVVHLEWQGTADLDLHLVDPAGVETWARHPNGLLDVDSNAQCLFDGRDQENIVFTAPPPPGHYVVRVDAFSLCGAALAAWRVDVLRDGTLVANASGEASDADTREAHDKGAGRTALELDVP
jgi:hypothetical protein